MKRKSWLSPGRTVLVFVPVVVVVLFSFIYSGNPMTWAALGAAALYSMLCGFVLFPKWSLESNEVPASYENTDVLLQRVLNRPELESCVELFSNYLHGDGRVERFKLVLPSTTGETRVISDQDVEQNLEIEMNHLYEWLQEGPLLVDLEELEQLSTPGAKEGIELLSVFNSTVLMQIKQQDTLLGCMLLETKEPKKSLYPFLHRFRGIASVGIANALLNEMSTEHKGAEELLDLAHTIQKSLMPDEDVTRGNRFEMRGLFRPADQCGGDMWAWRVVDGRKLVLVIADATGHGAAPALLSAVAKGAFEAYVHSKKEKSDPSELLEWLNQAVFRVGRKKFMMTALAIVLNLETGVLEYANAAHNFPYVFSDGNVGNLIVRGDSLGSGPKITYLKKDKLLRTGDRLLFVTDGIAEAGATSGGEYGDRRFRKLLSSLLGTSAIKMPSIILEELSTYLGQREAGDDITVVGLSYGDVGTEMGLER